MAWAQEARLLPWGNLVVIYFGLRRRMLVAGLYVYTSVGPNISYADSSCIGPPRTCLKLILWKVLNSAFDSYFDTDFVPISIQLLLPISILLYGFWSLGLPMPPNGFSGVAILSHLFLFFVEFLGFPNASQRLLRCPQGLPGLIVLCRFSGALQRTARDTPGHPCHGTPLRTGSPEPRTSLRT